MSKLTGIDGLAAAVPRGATIAVGGFQLSRVPVALLRALVARGTGELRAIAAPNPLGLDLLAAGGVLRAADCGFIGAQYEDGFVSAPALARGAAESTITLRQRDVHDTIEELRAAARNGRPLADFALLHAQRGDADGNLALDDPYADVLLAHGSARVLATVEEVVDAIDRPTIAANRVAAIARVPRGAAPTACFGYYRRDAAGVRAAWADAPPRRAVRADREGGSRHGSAADAFIVNLARLVHDGEVVVTGLASAVAMLAIGLAQRTHAPAARYINCIGAVNPRLRRAWATSVEPQLLADCRDRIDLPDLFDLARDGGVDAMFFGAGQVDAAGNINLDHIGPAAAPKVRLPGPAGSPSMRSWVRRVLVAVPRQSPRNLVASVDVATSSPAPCNRETTLVTDHAVWELRAGRFVPRSLAAGLDLQGLSSATGFPVAGMHPGTTSPPTPLELAALQQLDRTGERYRLLPGLRAFNKPPGAAPIIEETTTTATQQPRKVLHES